MISTMRHVLVLLTIIALLASNVTSNEVRPSRNNEVSNVADAMKYLQDLDTFYGDRARVRFGKRASLIQLLRNHLTNEAVMNHPAELIAAEEPF